MDLKKVSQARAQGLGWIVFQSALAGALILVDFMAWSFKSGPSAEVLVCTGVAIVGVALTIREWVATDRVLAHYINTLERYAEYLGGEDDDEDSDRRES